MQVSTQRKRNQRALIISGGLLCFVVVYGFISLYDEVVLQAPVLVERAEPSLTIQMNNGRLGNQMFSFATLFGLSDLNGRRMQLMPYNWQILAVYFHIQCDLVDFETFVPTRPWRIGSWLEERDKHIPRDSNILMGNDYPTSFTFFHHARQQLRNIFIFRDPIQQYVHDALRMVLRFNPRTKVFVGVHVRRGDYVRRGPGGWLFDFQGREVDAEYFRRATDHFRSKYGQDRVSFIAVSEDRPWCRKNLSPFGILTMPESPGAGHDLALLVACNHTIMTYGTYGFWGGYLSGGEVVYFTDFLKPNTSMTRNYFRYEKMYPEEWVGISTTREGYWDNYTNPFAK